MKLNLVFLLVFLFACGKEESFQKSCIDHKLEELNMIPYRGQELGCNFYLTRYVIRGKDYFLLNNNCADIIAYFTDCEGNRLSDDIGIHRSNRVEIVGIDKD